MSSHVEYLDKQHSFNKAKKRKASVGIFIVSALFVNSATVVQSAELELAVLSTCVDYDETTPEVVFSFGDMDNGEVSGRNGRGWFTEDGLPFYSIKNADTGKVVLQREISVHEMAEHGFGGGEDGRDSDWGVSLPASVAIRPGNYEFFMDTEIDYPGNPNPYYEMASAAAYITLCPGHPGLDPVTPVSTIDQNASIETGYAKAVRTQFKEL